jgi:hypothetical protein
MLRNSLLVSGFALLATLVPRPAAAQGNASTPSRTPDGKPNLAGIYSFSTITPLQRPAALAGKATLSDGEAEAFESSENTRLNRDLFDPIKGQPSAGYAPRAEGGVLSYNEFWYERGNRLTNDRRTSLIFDPADGTIPYALPNILAGARARRKSWSRRAPQPADSCPALLQLDSGLDRTSHRTFAGWARASASLPQAVTVPA